MVKSYQTRLLNSSEHFSSKPSFLDFEGDGDGDFVIGVTTLEGLLTGEPDLYIGRMLSMIQAPRSFLKTLAPRVNHRLEITLYFSHESTLVNELKFKTITSTTNSDDDKKKSLELRIAPKPIVADFDKDGDIDYLTGYQQGYIVLDENIGTQRYDMVPMDFIDKTYESGLFELKVDNNKWTLNVNRNGIDETTPNNHSLEFSIEEEDGTSQLMKINTVLHYPELQYTHTDPQSGYQEEWQLFQQDYCNLDNIDKVNLSAQPVFVDIDGDGDLDLFVSDSYGLIYYIENIGNSTTPAWAESAVTNPFGLNQYSSYASPTFVDLDDDGLMDCVIGFDNGEIKYYQK